ncbi:hypothetical protein [Pseudomonas sp. TCU-HL1]|uniref:hypothetical protein n=1 Tax=Pseudomonas sp. TCU-HL1 TaxID=1856685 RepID=UPI00083E09E4|nr:hypothetical protein [Pseudomonas sp. TCU-HL1]AOE85268.1 lipoprotein [Pseudomonas sp. TCU-HL1]
MNNLMLRQVEDTLNKMSVTFQFECLWEADGSCSITLSNHHLAIPRTTVAGISQRDIRDESSTQRLGLELMDRLLVD